MNKEIIDLIKAMQKKERLTDEAFAQRIGVQRGSWNRIKQGKAPFGPKFINGVKKAYPELSGVIDIFLPERVTKQTTCNKRS